MLDSDDLDKLKRMVDGHEEKLREAIHSDDNAMHADMIELISTMLVLYQKYVKALEAKLGIP